MPRITVNVDEETEAWLEEEADRLGTSKAAAGGRCIEVMYSDVGHITDDINLHQSTSAGDLEDIRRRLRALEDRIDAEASHAGAERVESETMDTLRDDAPRDVSDGDEPDSAGARAQGHALDAAAVEDYVRQFYHDDGPQKRHVREAVVATVRHLFLEGPASTAELKEIVMDVAGEHYSGKRNAWNSIDRYVEQVPGVFKPDYGMWDFDAEAPQLGDFTSGDDTARE